jgi:hypothetical protein
LDDLVSLERSRGVAVRDNDITIALGRVLPPPEIQGRLVGATIQGERLVQTFAPANGRKPRGRSVRRILARATTSTSRAATSRSAS